MKEIRLIFDNDMNRKYYNMPCCYPLVETGFKLPKTLIKEYVLEGTNEEGKTFSIHVTDNRARLTKHSVDWKVQKLRFIPAASHGCDEFRLFSFDIR